MSLRCRLKIASTSRHRIIRVESSSIDQARCSRPSRVAHSSPLPTVCYPLRVRPRGGRTAGNDLTAARRDGLKITNVSTLLLHDPDGEAFQDATILPLPTGARGR